MVGPEMKYSYKFRLDPVEKSDEPKEEDPREIQAYIDGILGVVSKRYANSPGGISR
jgi:hypothetical protein